MTEILFLGIFKYIHILVLVFIVVTWSYLHWAQMRWPFVHWKMFVGGTIWSRQTWTNICQSESNMNLGLWIFGVLWQTLNLGKGVRLKTNTSDFLNFTGHSGREGTGGTVWVKRALEAPFFHNWAINPATWNITQKLQKEIINISKM